MHCILENQMISFYAVFTRIANISHSLWSKLFQNRFSGQWDQEDKGDVDEETTISTSVIRLHRHNK